MIGGWLGCAVQCAVLYPLSAVRYTGSSAPFPSRLVFCSRRAKRGNERGVQTAVAFAIPSSFLGSFSLLLLPLPLPLPRVVRALCFIF